MVATERATHFATDCGMQFFETSARDGACVCVCVCLHFFDCFNSPLTQFGSLKSTMTLPVCVCVCVCVCVRSGDNVEAAFVHLVTACYNKLYGMLLCGSLLLLF